MSDPKTFTNFMQLVQSFILFNFQFLLDKLAALQLDAFVRHYSRVHKNVMLQVDLMHEYLDISYINQ